MTIIFTQHPLIFSPR